MSKETRLSDAEKELLLPNVEEQNDSHILQAHGYREEDGNEMSTFDHVSDAVETLRHGKMMEDESTDIASSSDDQLIALLCYWSQIVIPLVMPVIVLMSESGRQRPFQRYHAIQSLALMSAFIAMSGAAVVAGLTILSVIPPLGILMVLAGFCLSPIAYLMSVTALIFYGWQAHKGKRFSIPGLGRFLRDRGWLA